MIRYTYQKVDSLLPLLSSLQISSRTYIKKDKWGYNYVPKKPIKTWKKKAPLPQYLSKSKVIPAPASRVSKTQFLDRINADRTKLGRLFERPSNTTAVQPVEYKRGMLRTGLIGIKQGQTRLFLRDGRQEVGTLISIYPNYVLSSSLNYGKRSALIQKKRQYELTLGSVDVPEIDQLSLPVQSLYLAAGVSPKKFQHGFLCTEENVLPAGYKLDASHFFAGQYVDIYGKSIDRGFQGCIRRWGYRGQGFNLGRTKTHRRPGAIGTQGLAKVMKGKTMPGMMGNRFVSQKNCKIAYANYEKGYIVVEGKTQGPVGGALILSDSKAKRALQAEYLHYPTFLLDGRVLKEHYDGSVISPNEPTAGLLT